MSRWSLKWHIDPYCRTCFHGDAHIGACLYILNTEKRRPCPAGAGCTERITEKEWNEMQKQRAPRTVWTPEMVDELRRLKQEGLSATQIADRMGVDKKAVEAKCYNLGITRGKENGLEGFVPFDFQKPQGGVKTGISEPEERHEETGKSEDAAPAEETSDAAGAVPVMEPATSQNEEPREFEHMTIGKLVALCGEDRDTEIFVNGQPVRIVQYMERYDLEARCGAALVDLISADKNRQP